MVTSALTTLAGAFSGQTRRDPPQRAQIPSATGAIAMAKDKKTAKLAAKNAREERIWNLLSQPEVLGWMMTIGGILAVQNIPFNSDRAINEMLQGAATSATVIMGMGHAGVGDLTTSIIAGLAGVASIMEGVDLPDINLMGDNALPGLTVEESREVIRKAFWQSMPFGLGYVFKFY